MLDSWASFSISSLLLSKTSFVLGMDFMKRASVTTHVPIRTVLMGVDLPYPNELVEDGMDGHYAKP